MAESICWNCKNACGGCSWTFVDPKTKRPIFKPVDGWTAIKTDMKLKGVIEDGSYIVLDCPEFRRDRK